MARGERARVTDGVGRRQRTMTRPRETMGLKLVNENILTLHAPYNAYVYV